MMEEREKLYRHFPSPVYMIPVGVPPFPFLVDDSIQDDKDIDWAVRRLFLNSSGNPSGMKLEHHRQWLIAATRDDSPDATNRLKVASIVQAAFQGGTLTKECTWQTAVFIPKWKG